MDCCLYIHVYHVFWAQQYVSFLLANLPTVNFHFFLLFAIVPRLFMLMLTRVFCKIRTTVNICFSRVNLLLLHSRLDLSCNVSVVIKVMSGYFFNYLRQFKR